MDALDAYFFSLAIDLGLNKAVLSQWPVVLGNLITLREVGIEIVLACPL